MPPSPPLPPSPTLVHNLPPRTPDYTNPPFPTPEQAAQYHTTLLCPKDLLCPITHCPFTDPVLCLGDGCTYDRKGLLTWISLQQRHDSQGLIRSPVTNEYMEASAATTLRENQVVKGLASQYREKLGRELCGRCEYVRRRWSVEEVLGDEGFRMKCCVDCGADLMVKGCLGGSTALMCLVECAAMVEGELEGMLLMLVRYLLKQDASVLVRNDAGKGCLEIAKEARGRVLERNTNDESDIESIPNSNTYTMSDWNAIVADIERRVKLETGQLEARSREQSRINTQHRERQRLLGQQATNAALDADSDPLGLESVFRRTRRNRNPGLGTVQEEAWGYFPCLGTLLFWKNVPPPSASYVEYEEEQMKRACGILKMMGGIVLVYLVLC